MPFLNLGLVWDELLLSLELPAARPDGLWLLAARYLIPADPIKLLTLTTLTYEVEWFLSDIICDYALVVLLTNTSCIFLSSLVILSISYCLLSIYY
jgi:hypothetical protein